MKFIFSTKTFVNAEKVDNIYLEGNLFKSDNNEYFFFKPTLYEKEKNIQEYFQEFVKNKKYFISNLNGEFILFYYNANKNNIFFATDRLAKEIGLYYFDGKDLIITNSFWDGIKAISPKAQDINIQSMKEIIVYNRALLHNTIINNYKFIEPATFMEIKLNKNIEIKKKKYWQFNFNVNDVLEIDEVIYQIEKYFDSTFKMLKNKYFSKTRFGVGLSGGLDSRLVAYYCNKYNMKLIPYCIGEKYYIYPIKTRGYKIAKKIADYFCLYDSKFIEYNSESYFRKLFYDIYYLPYTNSSIEISPLMCIPDFDIMINGEHGGVFFGEFNFRPLLNYSKYTIHEYLLQFLCHHQYKNYVMNKNEETVALNKVKDYISEINTDDRYKIFYQFFFEIYGSKSQRGFFESNYGLKKSYSHFLDPNFFDYFLTWDSKFLIDRVLQKALFKKYYTELSKIPDETYDAPIFWREDSPKLWPRRFWYALMNYLFKPALRRGYWLKRDKEFKSMALKILSKNIEFVKYNFPNMNFEEYLKKNPRAAANFIKMKVIADIIINKGYDDIEYFINGYYRK